MAGHSKWANIKFRKGAQDKKRGKIFTRLIREITIAVKEGGGPDSDSNPRLRTAIDKALSQNMKKDKINDAIKRAAGTAGGASYERVRYEGYGPGGVAVIVDCMTDNRNRTVADVRHAFTKNGGNLGTDGSVAYLFEEQGLLRLPAKTDEDHIMEIAIEAGANDVIHNDDDSIEVQTTPEQFAAVRDAIVAADLKPELAEVTWVAHSEIPVNVEDGEKILKLLDTLDELDDVQEVYSNADIPEELI